MFKKIIKLMENKEGGKQVLAEKEVAHYYQMLKEPALRDSIAPSAKKALVRKGWKTLQNLMTGLMLQDDYALLVEGN